MDEERARELLAAERRRVEAAIAGRGSGEGEADAEQDDPGERDTEDLYEKELGVGLSGDLSERLGAIERAEQRLAEGTYGISVLSGALLSRLIEFPTLKVRDRLFPARADALDVKPARPAGESSSEASLVAGATR